MPSYPSSRRIGQGDACELSVRGESFEEGDGRETLVPIGRHLKVARSIAALSVERWLRRIQAGARSADQCFSNHERVLRDFRFGC